MDRWKSEGKKGKREEANAIVNKVVSSITSDLGIVGLHQLAGSSPDFVPLALGSIAQLGGAKVVLTRRENLEVLQQVRPDCESTMKCLGLAY